MLDWRKYNVECAECGASLLRRLYRPKDNKPIKRFFCDFVCKGEWQTTNLRPISRDHLRCIYLDKKMSANEIAKSLNRDPKRVWEWLRQDGIETRGRGSNTDIHFKKGHTLNTGKPRSAITKQKLRNARIADGSKGLFKNGVHILKGRRGPQHPRFKGGLTPERQSFYSSDEWKLACKVVWRRADAKCERCSLDHRTIDRNTMSFHVHHIVSFQIRELRADSTNLALLCQDCHRFVHSKRNADKQFIREAA